jgi:hypothetical protein
LKLAVILVASFDQNFKNWPVFTMADSDGDSSAGKPDNDGRKVRQVSVEEQRIIFHACRATMVNGRLKRGIFSELTKSMGFQARPLAPNGEEPVNPPK